MACNILSYYFDKYFLFGILKGVKITQEMWWSIFLLWKCSFSYTLPFRSVLNPEASHIKLTVMPAGFDPWSVFWG